MTDSPFPVLVERLHDLAADPAAVTDADLLARFVRDRDPVAFEALVWRHARLVMGVCRRTLRHHQDAEDAFQAVFLLLARKAHRIRRGAALPAWLHTTAVRIARRARKRRRPMPVAEVPEQPITDPPPEAAEVWAVLDAEIRRLPARLRAAFVLCGLEGRSHADAARDLGVPKGTIDSRMAAAKRRLRTALARRGLMLAPAAVLTAAVPELAYSDAARRGAALGLGRLADVSPAVVSLVAPTGAGRWLAGLAAAVTLAAAGTLAVMSGTAGPGDPLKPPDKPADGPKATAEHRLPAMTPLFKRTTVGLPREDEFEFDEPSVKATIGWLRAVYAAAIQERRKAGLPLIPPSVPAVTGNQLVYTNDKSIAVLFLGKDAGLDPTAKPGELAWAADLDVWDCYRREGSVRAAISTWMKENGDPRYDVLCHGTLPRAFSLGIASAERVDDLSFFPSRKWAKQIEDDQALSPEKRAEYELADELVANALKQIDLTSGKLRAKIRRGVGEASPAAPFGGTIFLGAPLTAGGETVVVHEKSKRIHLTCVSWKRISDPASVKPTDSRTADLLVAANNTFLWDTVLASTPMSVVADPHRRIHAIHLTRAGDLIVCPTHLGRVVAVEAKTGKVRWTHEYAPLDAKRFPTFAPEWVVVPPAVVGDRYVYAPADFPELLCLNVADGKKVWSVKKGDGLYPAVVGGQVLVVGEKTIRSLSLKDGSEQWKAELPGLPCGRGAVLGDAYLIPVSEPKTWKGLIAVVDLKAGKVAEVLRPEKDEPIGNLVVHGDFLISQTLTEISVFPIKKRE